MKIWTSQIPEPLPRFELIELGVFKKIGDTSGRSLSKSLVEVKKNTDIPEKIDGIEGFIIPAGCINLELLGQLQQIHSFIYITINGFTSQAIKELQHSLEDSKTVFVFESDNYNTYDYLEQLGWLASQNRPFAVASENKKQLLTACIFKPHALIIKSSCPSWIGELEHLFSITQAQAAKPLSETELDSIYGFEMGLVAAKNLPMGHILTNEDITTAITVSRGLGLHLRQKIIGQRMGYSLKLGEPITFGFLQDPLDAK